jgi:hypothetical protein
MSGTETRSPLSDYRDAVAGLIKRGEPFGDVEDVIDDIADLTHDQKAALWLFAFCLRDPAEQRLVAPVHLHAVQ